MSDFRLPEETTQRLKARDTSVLPQDSFQCQKIEEVDLAILAQGCGAELGSQGALEYWWVINGWNKKDDSGSEIVWRGIVKIFGKKQKVLLIDNNVNGVVDEGDQILLGYGDTLYLGGRVLLIWPKEAESIHYDEDRGKWVRVKSYTPHMSLEPNKNRKVNLSSRRFKRQIGPLQAIYQSDLLAAGFKLVKGVPAPPKVSDEPVEL